MVLYPLKAVWAACSQSCKELHCVIADVEVGNAHRLFFQEAQQHWDRVWALRQQLSIDCGRICALQGQHTHMYCQCCYSYIRLLNAALKSHTPRNRHSICMLVMQSMICADRGPHQPLFITLARLHCNGQAFQDAAHELKIATLVTQCLDKNRKAPISQRQARLNINVHVAVMEMD